MNISVLLDDSVFGDKAYRKEIYEFIKRYTNWKITILIPYNAIASCYVGKSAQAVLSQELLKEGLLNIVHVASVDVAAPSRIINKCLISEQVITELSMLKDIEVILFFGQSKHCHDYKGDDKLKVINSLYTELNSNIAKFARDGRYMDKLDTPSRKSPLPNEDLCKDYKCLQDRMCTGLAQNEKISIYIKVADEVLGRNGFLLDKLTSAKNKGAIRQIYHSKDKQLFASIDVEHGAIEIFDKDGRHIDEFTYTGVAQNKTDNTGKHDIII